MISPLKFHRSFQRSFSSPQMKLLETVHVQADDQLNLYKLSDIQVFLA